MIINEGDCDCSKVVGKKTMEQELYNQGLEKALQGDLQGAIQDFNQALLLNPQFTEAYYKRAVARFDLGDLQGAIADYNQALRLNPQSVESYFGRALALLALRDNQGAIADANQVIKINPTHAAAFNLEGTAYRSLGDTNQAIASLKKAAELYLEQKDTVNCRKCLDAIKKIQAPQIQKAQELAQTEAFFSQALQKLKLGKYGDALADFNWLLQVDPKDARAYCYRGIVRCRLRDNQGAIEDLGMAMLLNPQDTQVRYHRGLVRIELRDYRGAIDDFSQLIQSNPQNAEAYMNRGLAYSKLENYRQAIEDYSRGLSIKPKDADLYCHRAVARADFEDYQGAIDDYQKAANIYFDQQDWASYQQIVGKQKNLEAKARSQAQKRANKLNNEDVFINQEKQIWSNSQTNIELQERLLRMVGGYWEVAQRLIDLAKQKHPGMPENWYLEKVISDLERNR
jgi:tetratricopeptide (TPR) repeat protein